MDKGFLGFGPKLCKVLTTSVPGQHQKVHNIINFKVQSQICAGTYGHREKGLENVTFLYNPFVVGPA